MVRHICIFSGLLLMMCSASAQMGGGGMSAPAPIFIPDVDKESVIYQVPAKWYPYYKATDAKIDTFIFPTGQEPTDWKEALEIETYLTTLGATEARQVYELRTQGTSCLEHSVTLEKDTQENGYSMVQWVENCILEDETLSVTLAKTILGNEQLYIITKIWRYEPWDSHMTEWQGYLDEVYVCDPNLGTAHPCRPPNAPAGPRGGGLPPR